MSANNQQIHKVHDLKGALKAIRGAKHLHVHSRMDGYLHDDAEHYKPDYYTAGLEVTRKSMRKWLEDMFKYAPLNPNVYLKITVSTHKGYESYDWRTNRVVPAQSYTIVWIG